MPFHANVNTFKHCFKNCETNPNNAAGVFFPSGGGDLQLFPAQIVVIVKSALSSAPKLCLIFNVSLLTMVSTIFYMTITNCDDMMMVVVMVMVVMVMVVMVIKTWS